MCVSTEESTEIEPTDQARIQAANSGTRSNSNDDDLGAMDEDDDPEPGAPLLTRLNLDTDPKATSQRSGPNFSTVYTTTHKDMATSTAFSKDGRYAASGSADTSLKILDVNKMKLMNDDVHPVVRTLYDHETVRPLFPLQDEYSTVVLSFSFSFSFAMLLIFFACLFGQKPA